MSSILLLACIFCTSLAVRAAVVSVVSRDDHDERPPASAGNVLRLVQETVDNATRGISTEKLERDFKDIRRAARRYLKTNPGGKATLEDIKAEVNSAAAVYNLTLDVSQFNNNPVQADVDILTSVLTVINVLADRAQQRIDAGQSPRSPISAIRALAGIGYKVAVQLDTFVTYLAEDS